MKGSAHFFTYTCWWKFKFPHFFVHSDCVVSKLKQDSHQNFCTVLIKMFFSIRDNIIVSRESEEQAHVAKITHLAAEGGTNLSSIEAFAACEPLIWYDYLEGCEASIHTYTTINRDASSIDRKFN